MRDNRAQTDIVGRVLRHVVCLIGLWLSAFPALAQNQPPTITLWSPATTSSYEAPAGVLLRVSAFDPDGTVSKVEYYVNGALLGTLATPPFGATWTQSTAGTFTVTAKAFDNLNATTISNAVTITVLAANPANPAPSLTLVSPVNGATCATATAGGVATVQMYANTSDSNGTVNRVEYFIGGGLVCIALASP